MSVCIHWFPASNETEPPKTIMKNSNNITQEWNNCGQSYTSVKIFPPFWMCCQRLPVVWQAPYSPWQGENFSPQRPECRGPCCDCFWVDSALWEPNLCLALRLAGFGSLLVGVLEAAWCQLCLGPHAWTPVALRICRRNREGAQRESYGCKTRFCFQKHTFFSFRFLTGVKNVNSQKFGNNWNLSFHPDFAPPVSLLSSLISKLKIGFPSNQKQSIPWSVLIKRSLCLNKTYQSFVNTSNDTFLFQKGWHLPKCIHFKEMQLLRAEDHLLDTGQHWKQFTTTFSMKLIKTRTKEETFLLEFPAAASAFLARVCTDHSSTM